MSRYFNADTFFETFGELNTEPYNNFPTADVIEVVRCRDCKYMCHYTDGHIECRLLVDLKPIPTTYCTMKADDFCSYGERREQ